jgi:hypothetical protein
MTDFLLNDVWSFQEYLRLYTMIVMLPPFGSKRAFKLPTHLPGQLIKYQASPHSCERGKKLGYTILWIIWDLYKNEYCLRDFNEKNIFVCSLDQAKFHKVLLILNEDTLLEASFGNTHKILNLELHIRL